MKSWTPALTSGVVVENVGDQTLVMVGNPPRVILLSPEAVGLLTLIQHNPGNEVEQTDALIELKDLGVVEDNSPSTLSRRGVITLSAVAGAAGLSTVLLPTAAAASSSESPSFDAMGTYQFISNEWRFTLLKADFPDETQFGLGNLTIDGNAFDSQTGPTSKTWLDRVGGPYTGIVIGTLVGIDTGNSYTVGFTEVTAG